MWLRSRTVSSSTAVSVGEDRSFGDDTLLIERAVGQNVAQTRFETLAVFLDRLRGSLLHNGDKPLNGFELSEHVPAQPFAFALAHGVEFLHGFCRDLRERRGGFVFIQLAPLDREHIRESGKAGMRCVPLSSPSVSAMRATASR